METEKHPILRSPIVTVCGHVDHGKTSLLDCFRGSAFQEQEAGGITQKISFTKYPLEQIKAACPLIEKNNIALDIPGFLFIDTPGHAAFTSLRKRGGSLADLAIVVVSIKEGIKPQTAEVLQILKANKTPFVIALNKIDALSGWTKHEELRSSIDLQPIHARQEFDEALMLFQGSLREHGFDSDLYFDMADFTKKVAIVPCSARTREGIPELLLMLCGLCQRFLKSRLEVGEIAKGVILEVKKEKNMRFAEAIIYDGALEEGDELIIANFGEPIFAKVRALQEIKPLSNKYNPAKKVFAASGVRIQFAGNEDALPGMPFQIVKGDTESIIQEFRKEISQSLKLDSEGIIIKADSLGSLEALMTLLRQENIRIVQAGIGPVTKADILSAKANETISPLNAIIVGFNVELGEDVQTEGVKLLLNEVVYKLIEDLQEWRTERSAQIEKEKLLGLATICKLEILHKYVFRNSNPAIFGVKVLGGKLRVGIPLINEQGEDIARVKSIQLEKATVAEAKEGDELAMALPGVTFDRQLKDTRYLYADLGSTQIRALRKNEDLFAGKELSIISEIEAIKAKHGK